jgi:hypothetical protein
VIAQRRDELDLVEGAMKFLICQDPAPTWLDIDMSIGAPISIEMARPMSSARAL